MSPRARPRSAVVLGTGPGLGLSVAARWAAGGHPVAVVSRSSTRHGDYRERLRAAGSPDVWSVTADVLDADRVATTIGEAEDRLGPVGMLYFGPAGLSPEDLPVPIDRATATDVRRVVSRLVTPAISAVRVVLPSMLDRGAGTIVIPTGLSAIRAMPALGNLAVASAGLRSYARTLDAATSQHGVRVLSVVIGGAVRGGDIHRALTGDRQALAGVDLDPAVIDAAALDPDRIAAGVWDAAHPAPAATTSASSASTELVFSTLG